MDNFIIGTLRENIKLLFNNLHTVNESIPRKLKDLSDLDGKWTVAENGDIVPEISGTLNIGSINKTVKSLFLSENSLHIVKQDGSDTIRVKFGVSEDNSLEITQETLSDTQSDSTLQQTQSNPLTVPSKKQLLFSETAKNILINSIKSVDNTSGNDTIIINATNVPIVAGTPGIYISPITEYTQTVLNNNVDLRPLYYNSSTKEMFRSDGSGHFTDLNLSGIIKGPAELVIDPSPIADNAGTVRIKGNPIVDGTQTIINSTIVIIKDNIFGINAVKGVGNTVVGAGAAEGGLNIYGDSGAVSEFIYDFNTAKWRTGPATGTLNNLITGELEAAKMTTSLVDISGGNITKTLIGSATVQADRAAAYFTTVSASNGFTGNVDGQVTDITNHSINDLSDVSITSDIANDDLLRYDSTASKWVHSKGVKSKAFGNIVETELSTGAGRSATQSVTSTEQSVPLHTDILNHFSGTNFAAGQCVVGLDDGTAHSAVAMFSFSLCSSSLSLVLDQEVHSSSGKLKIDYDSASGTLKLELGTGVSATYCVKVLPIMTSDSISESY